MPDAMGSVELTNFVDVQCADFLGCMGSFSGLHGLLEIDATDSIPSAVLE